MKQTLSQLSQPPLDLTPTKQGDVVLPQGSDLSKHLHMITSSIFEATSVTSAARLQLKIIHLLVSHSKFFCCKYRWNVSYIIILIRCLVSEKAATIDYNYAMTFVVNVDSSCIRLELSQCGTDLFSSGTITHF